MQILIKYISYTLFHIKTQAAWNIISLYRNSGAQPGFF